ncbi:unnamed protein product [Closterium sp. Naga37s-1]|nr:unnamed protein product [Closterium sp. Naga37s-1]
MAGAASRRQRNLVVAAALGMFTLGTLSLPLLLRPSRSGPCLHVLRFPPLPFPPLSPSTPLPFPPLYSPRFFSHPLPSLPLPSSLASWLLSRFQSHLLAGREGALRPQAGY